MSAPTNLHTATTPAVVSDYPCASPHPSGDHVCAEDEMHSGWHCCGCGQRWQEGD